MAFPSPSPFLASAKCFASSYNRALCIFGCQPSVKRMSLSPKVERKVEPATWYTPCHNSSHRGPENADRGVKEVFLPKSKSGFSLESAQWGAHLVSCVTEKSKLFLARVVCVKNMLSILLVRAHHFDEIKCDICSNFKQLNQC